MAAEKNISPEIEAESMTVKILKDLGFTESMVVEILKEFGFTESLMTKVYCSDDCVFNNRLGVKSELGKTCYHCKHVIY